MRYFSVALTLLAITATAAVVRASGIATPAQAATCPEKTLALCKAKCGPISTKNEGSIKCAANCQSLCGGIAK